MWGTYQKSSLRIEIAAGSDDIRRSLVALSELRKWLKPQQIRMSESSVSLVDESLVDESLVDELSVGQSFESALGPLKIQHEVEMLSEDGIRFLLSEGVDGFHEWQWGDGWIQSRLEGVSLLPLSLGQTASIVRLQHYLQQRSS